MTQFLELAVGPLEWFQHFRDETRSKRDDDLRVQNLVRCSILREGIGLFVHGVAGVGCMCACTHTRSWAEGCRGYVAEHVSARQTNLLHYQHGRVEVCSHSRRRRTMMNEREGWATRIWLSHRKEFMVHNNKKRKDKMQSHTLACSHSQVHTNAHEASYLICMTLSQYWIMRRTVCSSESLHEGI